MSTAVIVRWVAASALVALALVAGYNILGPDADPVVAPSPARAPLAAVEAHSSALYGRVTTTEGATYEGRLRWGGDEEAFWGHYFNGYKDENPWAAYVPVERLTRERDPIEVFGLKVSRGEAAVDLGRPFMARFGDIARIEARGNRVRLDARGDGVRGALDSAVEYDPDVRVTLKSGTAFDLDRLEAGDFDDGVRVWDDAHGVVDLGPRQIRTIELLPADRLGEAPERLHGTVRTPRGDFTGFLQWEREASLGRDVLTGTTAAGERTIRFDAIRSIARRARGGSLVTLRDGREIVFSDIQTVGLGHRGTYVDDGRYGRVLISWDAFERVDFSPGGGGPSYGDFPAGRPLTGRVTTHDGRRLEGRLVYDLDESETTETLDAPSQGVDYTIPFALVASVVLPAHRGPAADRARVILRSGEELQLERAGDLGEGNAGLLVFTDDDERSEYVPWDDVERIDFDRPPAMNPSVE